MLCYFSISSLGYSPHLQSRKRQEQRRRLVGTAEEEEGGMNEESSNETCTSPYVKQIANGKLLYDTGSSTQYSVTT